MSIEWYLSKFVNSYMGTALWASLDNDAIEGRVDREGENLDDNFDTDDISEATKQAMREDCESFVKANWDDLMEIDGDASQAGHDFWLTRHRHGAGFWDRGYGEPGDRLTKASHTCGEMHLWANEEGEICHG